MIVLPRPHPHLFFFFLFFFGGGRGIQIFMLRSKTDEAGALINGDDGKGTDSESGSHENVDTISPCGYILSCRSLFTCNKTNTQL